MSHQILAEINLNHLQHNIQVVRKTVGPRFICPMVKAEAYGHDDVLISRALEKMSVEQMGVCLIEEGVRIREAGVKSKILVFRTFNQSGFEAIQEYGLTAVINSWDQIEILKSKSSSLKKPIELHVKFDTGMGRLGFSVDDAEKVSDFFKQNKLFKVAGVMTHLAASETSLYDPETTSQQIEKFEGLRPYFQIPGVVFHCLNSGGVLSEYVSRRDKNFDQSLFKGQYGARPGIMIYGYNPGVRELDFKLKPVMQVKAIPMALRSLKKGMGVSYNHRWKAQRDSVIAVIPMGYGDGYPRALTNRGQALYEGRLVPVVGTVCMDYLMLDVTDVEKNPNRQDLENIEVVLWGHDLLTAQDVADKAGTISYEILTRLGQRVPRVPIGEILNVGRL